MKKYRVLKNADVKETGGEAESNVAQAEASENSASTEAVAEEKISRDQATTEPVAEEEKAAS